jgi:hypothetical protein
MLNEVVRIATAVGQYVNGTGSSVCAHACVHVYTHFRKNHIECKSMIFLEVAVPQNNAVCGQAVLNVCNDF